MARIPNYSGARRKTCLKKSRSSTPPALSFYTERVVAFPERYASVVSDNLLPEFKQAVVGAKTTSSNNSACSMVSPESASTNIPLNLTHKNEYSATTTKPVTPLTLKSLNDGDSKLPARPSLSDNTDFDVRSIGNSDEGSSRSSISDDFLSTDGKEIYDVFGSESVPYKPLSYNSRRSICRYIGMDFKVDWMQIIGFEVEHSDKFAAIKNWTDDNWACHLDLLTDTGMGTEMELYAFAAMFSIDVWVFHKKEWLCYRPKFLAIGNECEEINIRDYCVGAKEGVYLMCENYLFSPVLTPSVRTKIFVL
ncbi:hypothetical protein LOAG_07745 [Loa loa]|uniref:Uncharacterized protein n=1 Tax=Loa loa TaxID=7209 RepID=A0A1S0TV90_LOALO|nr:hypothetical protein LOAG_07745 [Loa loa]EFO20745.1 hypothetical protein LOAG_07745 [Loa loa]